MYLTTCFSVVVRSVVVVRWVVVVVVVVAGVVVVVVVVVDELVGFNVLVDCCTFDWTGFLMLGA